MGRAEVVLGVGTGNYESEGFVPHFKARPTIYNGIQMRSRLEAHFAATLDRKLKPLGGSWKYEPECFADEKGQYLPDFSIEVSGQTAYIEVKPTEDLALADLVGRMMAIRSTLPDAELWAVWAEPLPVDAYGPGRYGWYVSSAPHKWVDGIDGVVASLARSGCTADLYEVDGWPVACTDPVHGTHIVVAPEHEQRDAAIAVHKHNAEQVWVVAASGAAGGRLPLVEFSATGDITDRYPGGHSFTMSSTDVAMQVIAVSDYRA